AYLGKLQDLVSCLGRFAPIDDCGNPFAPMVEYRDGLIAQLQQLWDDTVKASEVPWAPTNFALTWAAWKQTKDQAVDAGWKEKATGLSGALADFEKAHKALAAEPKKRATRIAVLSALDGVKEALRGMRTTDDFRRPHPGMERYKAKMLEVVQRRT